MGLGERGTEVGRDVYVCFVDYGKAFDQVDWVKLMRALRRLGVDYRAELDMGWVHPWVGSGWVVLGWVVSQFYFLLMGRVGSGPLSRLLGIDCEETSGSVLQSTDGL